jgi:hypothetical protein
MQNYIQSNVVIVRLDRTIQWFLDSPIESGNDDKVCYHNSIRQCS